MTTRLTAHLQDSPSALLLSLAYLINSSDRHVSHFNKTAPPSPRINPVRRHPVHRIKHNVILYLPRCAVPTSCSTIFLLKRLEHETVHPHLSLPTAPGDHPSPSYSTLPFLRPSRIPSPPTWASPRAFVPADSTSRACDTWSPRWRASRLQQEVSGSLAPPFILYVS